MQSTTNYKHRISLNKICVQMYSQRTASSGGFRIIAEAAAFTRSTFTSIQNCGRCGRMLASIVIFDKLSDSSI